jgi:hypothetical protein
MRSPTMIGENSSSLPAWKLQSEESNGGFTLSFGT